MISFYPLLPCGSPLTSFGEVISYRAPVERVFLKAGGQVHSVRVSRF